MQRRQVVGPKGVGGFADRTFDAGGGRLHGQPVALHHLAQGHERHDRVASPVQRRPDQLRHPGVQHDLWPASIAKVEHPGDQPAGPRNEYPARFDGQPRRSTIGRDDVQQGGQLASESLRGWRRRPDGLDRETAAQIQRVERLDGAAPQRGQGEAFADRVAPGIDRAQLRADMEVDPARPESIATGLDGCPDLRLVHAELAAARAHRQPGQRFRGDVRVEPVQDVQSSVRPSGQIGQVRCLLRGLQGDPQERVTVGRSPHRGAQIRRRLADAFQGDSGVRHSGAPSPRPLPARHHVGPKTAGAYFTDHRRNVVGLDRELSDDRVRKGRSDGRTRCVQRATVQHVDGRAPSARDCSQFRREGR